jgi:hypothetical protein
MSAQVLSRLLEEAESLTVDEQLQLVVQVAERARGACARPARDYKWEDACGAAAPSLLGEDAQGWVTRTRRESDAHREQLRNSTQ